MSIQSEKKLCVVVKWRASGCNTVMYTK